MLVMGGTVYSFTTVLVAFMSGLALGGWLGGRYADRTQKSPLLIYGIIEGLIGFYCLLIPFFIRFLDPIFDAFYPVLVGHRLIELLIRFFFSLIILVLPTTLMGATLPLLVRYVYSRREEFGELTARLYSINTFGAVAGSFVSGMVLIPSFGQRTTLYISALINFLILLFVLLLYQMRREEFIPAKQKLDEKEAQAKLNLKASLVLLGYALSGFSAMVYQVAWTRALILSLGTTLYVLSLILTAYIAGLAVGAGVITPLADKIKNLWLWIGIFELLIGISAWLVVPVFSHLPLWMVFIYRPESYYSWLALEFALGTALIFLPTFLMGALLPLVCRLYAELRGGVGEAVGEVYAWNTIGAIAGSFVCGFFLINWLGLKGSLGLASALSILIGLGFVFGEKVKIKFKAPIWAIGAIALVFLIAFQPGWNPKIISSGTYVYWRNYVSVYKNARQLKKYLDERFKLLFHKEGVEATVSVFEVRDTRTLILRINGKTDASTGEDMVTQVFTGHLPLMLHPGPQRVMILGLASGVTMGAVLTHPVKKVDCVEISPEVVEASRYFNSVNHRPLEDERSWLLVNDARYYLAHTSQKYDVIISEPSNPWIGGMGLLFTREFFQQAKSRLNKGGVMLVWMEIYDLDLHSVKLFVRAFTQVFPNASLWESMPSADYILVGVNGDFGIDYQRIKDAFANTKVKEDLKRVGLGTPEKVIARFLMGPDELKRFAGKGEIHTDDRRQLELYIPKVGYQLGYNERVIPVIKEFLEYRISPLGYLKGSVSAEERERIENSYLARLYLMEGFYQAVGRRNAKQGAEFLTKAFKIDPEDSYVRERLYMYFFSLGKDELAKGEIEKAINHLSRAWDYSPKNSTVADIIGFYYLTKGEFELAQSWLERAIKVNSQDAFAWYLSARIELKQFRPELAKEKLERAINILTEREQAPPSLLKGFLQKPERSLKAEVYFYLGEAFRQMGDKARALYAYEQALLIEPDYPEALLASGKMFLDAGKIDSALKRFFQATQIDPNNPFAHLLYAYALEQVPERKEPAINELKKALNLLPPDWKGREKIEEHLRKLISQP